MHCKDGAQEAPKFCIISSKNGTLYLFKFSLTEAKCTLSRNNFLNGTVITEIETGFDKEYRFAECDDER